MNIHKHNTGKEEGYTPPKYIEAARKVMGSIDLDPASNEYAQQWVKAKKFYTKEDDGLSKDWQGNIWLNPPYSRGVVNQFVLTLVGSKYNSAIVLTNNSSETSWGGTLLKYCSAVCFVKGRIKFITPDGEEGGKPLHGQMFTYFGTDVEKFKEEFSKFGTVFKGVA